MKTRNWWAYSWCLIAILSILGNVYQGTMLSNLNQRYKESNEKLVQEANQVYTEEFKKAGQKVLQRVDQIQKSNMDAMIHLMAAYENLLRAEQLANNAAPKEVVARGNVVQLVTKVVNNLQEWQRAAKITSQESGQMIPPLSPHLSKQLKEAGFRITRAADKKRWRIAIPTFELPDAKGKADLLG